MVIKKNKDENEEFKQNVTLEEIYTLYRFDIELIIFLGKYKKIKGTDCKKIIIEKD